MGAGPPPRPGRRRRAWQNLSPHSLRHSAITFALDADATLRDLQDYAGHNDLRTTRRYDHFRDNLDRNAAYTVAAYLTQRPILRCSACQPRAEALSGGRPV